MPEERHGRRSSGTIRRAPVALKSTVRSAGHVPALLRAPHCNRKYIRFGLRIETGAERTTIVDIFDMIQQVRDTGIHLKGYRYSYTVVDQEPKSSRGPQNIEK